MIPTSPERLATWVALGAVVAALIGIHIALAVEPYVRRMPKLWGKL